MYPIGHLALGYLLYVALTRVTDWRLPRGLTLLALALGTQAPDLIDKPLTYVGVLPNGRSLAHSILIIVPVLVILTQVATIQGFKREARAFVVAIGSHLIGDSYLLVLRREWAELGFLLWPVIPAIDYPEDDISPWVRLLNAGFESPQMQFQYALFAVAVGIWLTSVYRQRQTGL